MLEKDLTKKDVLDVLAYLGIQKKSRLQSDYRLMRVHISNKWNDQIARWVSDFVGI